MADDVSSYLAFPIGGIVIWSGTIAQIPAGWYLCDGGTYGGIKTPDLRNRFIIGAAETGTGTAASPNAGPGFDATTGAIASNHKIHNVGGEAAHQLTVAEMPSHNHPSITLYRGEGGGFAGGNGLPSQVITNGATVPSQGGDKYHENRPPYYALAYIMKCELKAGTTQNIATTTPTLQELRLNGPLYDQEMDGGAQKGNEGDVLISLGDGNGVRWQSQINLQNEQTFAAAGNTFTGIPSWAKRITIMFDSASMSGDGDLIIQLNGQSSGYLSNGCITSDGNVVSGTKYTTGFGIVFTNPAQKWAGHMILTKMSGNKWVSSHVLGIVDGTASNASTHGGGVVTLSDNLSTLKIVPSSGQTIDNGSFNIMYE